MSKLNGILDDVLVIMDKFIDKLTGTQTMRQSALCSESRQIGLKTP